MRRGFIAFALIAGALTPQLVSAQTGTRFPWDGGRMTFRLGEWSPPRVPPQDSIPAGDRTIAGGATARGPVVASRGNLEVRGTIDGDAVVYDGDIVLHPGGRITGDAVAVRGRILLLGGQLLGEPQVLARLERGPVVIERARSAGEEMRRNLGMALGLVAILALIGIGVLIFAGEYLDAVSETLQRQFMRSLGIGILGQLGLLPVLLLGLAALALTIIGLLLIPFAIVAYLLAAAGALTLGFLAMARLAGAGLAHPGGTARARVLRSVLVGIAAFGVIWLFAAALTAWPLVAAIVDAFVLIFTWVAVSAGFGAVILSRGGVRSPAPEQTPAPPPADDAMTWLTPTPVTGVVAARRPTPVPRADAG